MISSTQHSSIPMSENHTRSLRVCAVGSLPPPITGNSASFKSICAELDDLNPDAIKVIDITGRADNRIKRGFNKIIAYIRSWVIILNESRVKRRRIYHVCEGAKGLPFTALTVLISRFLKYKIYLHHHSFGYINNYRVIMYLINIFMGNYGNHIFLSSAMAERFFDVYHVRRNYLINHNLTQMKSFISNARSTPRLKSRDRIRVGHLSNLSFEKGLDTFVAIAETAIKEALELEFVLGGPAMSAVERDFIEDAQNRMRGRFTWVGAQYGDEKIRFFKGIDIFLFPTRYYHEAQPIVLLEALASGCAVISVDRGCIGEDMRDLGGIALPPDQADNPEAYLALVRSFSNDKTNLTARRARSLKQTVKMYRRVKKEHNAWINNLAL